MEWILRKIKYIFTPFDKGWRFSLWPISFSVLLILEAAMKDYFFTLLSIFAALITFIVSLPWSLGLSMGWLYALYGWTDLPSSVILIVSNILFVIFAHANGCYWERQRPQREMRKAAAKKRTKLRKLARQQRKNS